MEDSENDDDIKALLEFQPDETESDKRLDKAIRRARATVGQRDTLVFALVRFWTTLAKLLAPLFARAARAQAEAGHRGASARRRPSPNNTRRR